MPDWKKEIRVSDLFRKKDKAEERAAQSVPHAAAPSGPTEPHAGGEQTSFWKRDVSLSGLFKRGDKRPSEAPTPSMGESSSPPPSAPAAHAPAAQASPHEQRSPAPGAQPPPAQHVPAQPMPGQQPPAPAAEQHDSPTAASPDVFPPSASQQEAPSAPPTPTDPATSTPTTASAEEETSVWKREVRASDLLKKMGWVGGAEPKAPRGGVASEKRTPRPGAPRPDSPAAPPAGGGGAEDASVWKRELKAGDLLRRREKAPAVPADAFSEGNSEPVSFWKKEISLNDLLRQPGSQDETTATQSAPGATKTGSTKGKRRGLDLGRLKGVSMGRGAGSRRSSPHTPIAIPLSRAVNLLPPDLLPQKKKTLGPAEIAAGVAAVAVIIGLFILYTSASGKVSDAEQQLAAVQAEQAQLAENAVALDAAVGGVVASPLLPEEAARASALSSALESRTAWDRVLRKVTVVMPADTWLRGLGGSSTTADLFLTAGDGLELTSTLAITGYSLTRDGVAKLLSRLETIPELGSVSLLAATQTTFNDETVIEFSIAATLEDNTEAEATAETIGLAP